MHGIIFNQLLKFVRENYGFDVLNQILEDSQLDGKFYDATKAYPDKEIVTIVASACKRLMVKEETVLEAFGRFLVPGLIQTYQSYILPSWRTIDLLAHIETTMHRAVRQAEPEASPPRLEVKKCNKDKVEIRYFSGRNMHALGVGLIKGVAEHYEEEDNLKISISEIENGKLITVKIEQSVAVS